MISKAAIRAEADALRLSGQVDVMRQALDAATSAKTDLLNPVRVQRAYEVQRATGQSGTAYIVRDEEGVERWVRSPPSA